MVGIASDMAAVIRRLGISYFRILELYAWEGEPTWNEGGWERGERKGGKMKALALLESAKEIKRERYI